MSKRNIIISLILLVLLFGCSCDLENSQSKEIMVMTYNVQNLFDAYVSGTEYPEFTPEGGWNGQLYRLRLERTAQAITQGHTLVPSIVLLQEVENSQVVKDLVELHLKKYRFNYMACTSDEESAIQVAIVSCYPIKEARIHSIQGVRSVLETHIDVMGNPLIIFTLHAKSRIGGAEESEPLRVATANAISKRTEELLQNNNFLPIIIGGDFNESADSFYREEGAFEHALIPLTALSHLSETPKGLIVTGSAPPNGCWYTNWLDPNMLLHTDSPGSYYYKGVWESFDQLLLSPAFFDNYGVEFKNSYVASFAPLVDQKGRPNSWDSAKRSGFSDHLPTAILLSGF